MRFRSASIHLLASVLFVLVTASTDAVAQAPTWIPEPLPPVADAWARLRSPNFTVVGNVGEKRLREVALRCEQFRQVLGMQLPESLTILPAPVTVVAFAYSRDASRFDRAAFDKLVAQQGGPAGTTMVLALEGPHDTVYGGINAAYLNLVLSKLIPGLPRWLQTGLLAYYGTFSTTKDGRMARVGVPLDQGSLNLMRAGRAIPLAELIAAGRGEQQSAANQMAGRFRSQSWALAHYLQLGSPARAGEARDYMNRLKAGEDGVAAFRAAFGDLAKLEEELSRYIFSASFSYQEISVASPIAKPADYQFARLPDAEVQAIRACVKPGSSPE